MPGCSAFDCHNLPMNPDTSGLPTAQKRISFHRFPLSNGELLKRWLHNIGRKDFTPTEKSRLCSAHFLESSFKVDMYAKLMLTSPRKADHRPRRLNDDAVPTEFTHRRAPQPRSTTVSRLERLESARLVTELLSHAESTSTHAEITPSRKRTSQEKIHPISAKKKRKPAETVTLATLERVDELEPSTSMMVDIVESPAKNIQGFTSLSDLQATPLKYTCVYGTPRRSLKDHGYAQFDQKSRAVGTQTEATLFSHTLVQEMDRTPQMGLPPSSPFSEVYSEKETPGKSSDFQPLSESSTSASDSDEVEALNPCDVRKFIVFENCLGELHKFCRDCGSPVTECSTFTTGSMVSYKISCHKGHSYVWNSQPLVRKQPIGNLLIAGAILTSGSTFGKMNTFAGVLKLQLFSKTIYNKIQRQNLLPVIQEAWEQERVTAVNEVKKESGKLVLAGDARCDSPGHTAKYGSYTLMHSNGKTGTKKIVSMKLVQVSEVKNSNHMEPEGLKRCLAEVTADKLKVAVLATDRHKMVNSIMNKDYKKINHQFDTWHVAKGIVKKITAKAKKKACAELGPWIQSISNHLWWCCATCSGDEQLLREKWLSVLHHVTNRHRWTGSKKFRKCQHPPLSAAEKKSTKWLKPKSPAFAALQAIVSNKSLLTAMAKLTNFCHTGELKFCPKRLHFHYDVMYARLMLAAIEWNNTNMEQRKDKSGQPATSVVYSKRRKLFVLRNRYTKLKSDHMSRLLKRVFEVHNKKEVMRKFDRPAGLPRNVAKIQKPAKSELAAKFKSRFN